MSFLFGLIFCSLLVIADQVFKYLVIEFLKPIEYIIILPNILQFRYVENSGAAFGIFSSNTVVLTIVSVILMGVLLFCYIKNKGQSRFVDFCLLLMLSGGVGNITDRIRLQYVVDFIEPLFIDFAVFNFADCLITVGAFALIIYLLIDLVKEFKKEKAQKTIEANSDGNNWFNCWR